MQRLNLTHDLEWIDLPRDVRVQVQPVTTALIYAARCLPDLIDRVLGEAGLTRETVDVIVPHQASNPGVEHVRRLMGGDPARVIDIFNTHGNQIAASLPTALTLAQAEGRLGVGKTVLLLGTAAGISAAAMVIRT